MKKSTINEMIIYFKANKSKKLLRLEGGNIRPKIIKENNTVTVRCTTNL